MGEERGVSIVESQIHVARDEVENVSDLCPCLGRAEKAKSGQLVVNMLLGHQKSKPRDVGDSDSRGSGDSDSRDAGDSELFNVASSSRARNI
jgi:hypothetical protein